METYESTLDTSWINDVKKEIDIDTNYNKEHCDQINTIFIFVDIENNIHKINSNKENLSITENKRLVTKERLIQIIECKKRENPKIKYSLTNILLYSNQIDTNDIRTYAKMENMDKEGLKVLSIFDEIVIPESIFIFHSINAIYFIFKQTKSKSFHSVDNKITHENNIKSILKNKTKTSKYKQSVEHNITKKVEFKDECSPIPNQNITKKNYDNDDVDHDDDHGGHDNNDDNGTHDKNKHNKTRRL